MTFEQSTFSERQLILFVIVHNLSPPCKLQENN